jgi:hypothetical protein
MEAAVGLWTSHSDPVKQKVTAWGCAAVGLAMTVALRDFGAMGENATAAFALGVLLLVVGVAGILFAGAQTVTIDPRSRRITIRDVAYVGSKERVIAFDDIAHIGIAYLGKRSNFVQWWYLNLKLRGGENYPLFAPGRFYEGASDRSTVEAWKLRLERCIDPREPVT